MGDDSVGEDKSAMKKVWEAGIKAQNLNEGDPMSPKAMSDQRIVNNSFLGTDFEFNKLSDLDRQVLKNRDHYSETVGFTGSLLQKQSKWDKVFDYPHWDERHGKGTYTKLNSEGVYDPLDEFLLMLPEDEKMQLISGANNEEIPELAGGGLVPGYAGGGLMGIDTSKPNYSAFGRFILGTCHRVALVIWQGE